MTSSGHIQRDNDPFVSLVMTRLAEFMGPQGRDEFLRALAADRAFVAGMFLLGYIEGSKNDAIDVYIPRGGARTVELMVQRSIFAGPLVEPMSDDDYGAFAGYISVRELHCHAGAYAIRALVVDLAEEEMKQRVFHGFDVDFRKVVFSMDGNRPRLEIFNRTAVEKQRSKIRPGMNIFAKIYRQKKYAEMGFEVLLSNAQILQEILRIRKVYSMARPMDHTFFPTSANLLCKKPEPEGSTIFLADYLDRSEMKSVQRCIDCFSDSQKVLYIKGESRCVNNCLLSSTGIRHMHVRCRRLTYPYVFWKFVIVSTFDYSTVRKSVCNFVMAFFPLRLPTILLLSILERNLAFCDTVAAWMTDEELALFVRILNEETLPRIIQQRAEKK